MKSSDPWQRLARRARPDLRRHPSGPAEMPFGFDTRVLARLRVPKAGAGELWVRLALRALPLGAAVLLLCWVALPERPAAPEFVTEEVEQLMQEVLLP